MKASRPANHSFESHRRQKVVDLWRSLGEPEVGEDELRQIQKGLDQQLVAARGITSPATIARILADEGAEMRHPGIIEFDARWREGRIRREAERFTGLEKFSSGTALSRENAEALIKELERLRQRFDAEADREALAELTTFASEARRAAQLAGKNPTSDPVHQAEQTEIAEWIKIWIQTPALFFDWLALRKSSPEFRAQFNS